MPEMSIYRNKWLGMGKSDDERSDRRAGFTPALRRAADAACGGRRRTRLRGDLPPLPPEPLPLLPGDRRQSRRRLRSAAEHDDQGPAGAAGGGAQDRPEAVA